MPSSDSNSPGRRVLNRALRQFRALLRVGRQALRWLLWLAPLSALVGSASALFLWSLDEVTRLRFDHAWLLYLLPVSGVLVAWLYRKFGGTAEQGTNLLVDEIHQPGGGVPRRMAPLILIGTLLTHLCGGSAGREGTAVQMGGGIASAVAKFFRIEYPDRQVILMAGIAAGFGGVFGTPLAGAVFALEVLVAGRLDHHRMLHCLTAAWLGHATCQAWGIRHEILPQLHALSPIGISSGLDFKLVFKVAIASLCFGVCAWGFVRVSHLMARFYRKLCPDPVWRPGIGGVVVILLVLITGTRQYLGLGVSSPNPADLVLRDFFSTDQSVGWSWAWKIIFTVATLSSGLKGGEVTPIFFIGAALGNDLSHLLGAPTDLFAALGFISLFAAASKTPIACTLMGLELFGPSHALLFMASCFIARQCSGHSGIYESQRRLK